MTDLLIVAQSVPSTQSISLLQLVIGLVSVVLAVAGVVLAVAGIAWRAGRAVATKDDLAALKAENEKAHAGITDNLMENRRQIHENRRQIQQVATKDDLAALKTENEKAHAGITDNLMENRRQIHENRRQIQQVAESMRSIDRSVAFLSGRLHERDQSDEARRQALGEAQETHG